MIVSHIAVPYAKALFDLSVEKNVLEETMKDMQVVADLIESSKDFRMMLKSPVVSVAKKKAVFNRIFGNVLSKLTFSFLFIIIRKKREAYIGDIAFAFIELYQDYKGILITNFKTAVPATDDIRKKVLELMKPQSKGTVELIEEVDAELIGGFILQWKDRQIDGSISRQLRRLQRGAAMINLYRKGF